MKARKRILRYAVPFAIWSVPAVFLTVVGMLREDGTTLRTAFLSEGVAWYFWALVTPLILDIAARYPLESLRRPRIILLHVGAALGLGFLDGLLAAFTYLAFANQPPPDLDPWKFVTIAIIAWTCFGTLFYGMIAAVGFVLSYQRRLREREIAASQLEARLVEAQLSALRMQLHPHFLFNTLNTIAMYVREGDAATSTRLLARLSELLRHLLDDGGTQEVTLGTELEYARRYLDIEGTRFSDRLHVQWEIPEELKDAFVPNLVLQPLLENAIRHGIAARTSAGRIELSAARENGQLRVRLRNEGPALPEGWSLDGSRGIGLRNTAMRLQHLYGKHGQLHLRDWDAGVDAEVSLPFRTTPATSA